MKKIRMVVFDVDGTLLNTEFLWGDVWNIVGKKYNCPAFCGAHDLVVGITGSDLQKVLDERLYMVTPEQRQTMLLEARKIGMDYLKEHVQAMPYAYDIVVDLQAQGYVLSIATTTNRALTEERLKQTKLFDRFSGIICGDEVEKRKPDPEIYLKVCAAMDIAPAETLVIEDTGFGVQSAYRAGCTCIMVPSVNPPAEAEIDMAFAIVKNLNEAGQLIRQVFIKGV